MQVGDIVLFRKQRGVVLSFFTRLSRGRAIIYAKCFWLQRGERSSWPVLKMKVISEKR